MAKLDSTLKIDFAAAEYANATDRILALTETLTALDPIKIPMSLDKETNDLRLAIYASIERIIAAVDFRLATDAGQQVVTGKPDA